MNCHGRLHIPKIEQAFSQNNQGCEQYQIKTMFADILNPHFKSHAFTIYLK
jgi:hypothetical protein